jgi:hypothetical protein
LQHLQHLQSLLCLQHLFVHLFFLHRTREESLYETGI